MSAYIPREFVENKIVPKDYELGFISSMFLESIFSSVKKREDFIGFQVNDENDVESFESFIINDIIESLRDYIIEGHKFYTKYYLDELDKYGFAILTNISLFFNCKEEHYLLAQKLRLIYHFDFNRIVRYLRILD